MHEVRRVHEEDLPHAPPRFLQPGFQLLVEEFGLGLDVFLERGFGGDREGGHLAWLQAQAMQEVADLRRAPADAGVFLDEMAGVLDTARRMRGEDLFEGGAVVIECAGRLLDGDLTQQVQAALDILGKGGLDGAA